MSLILPPKTDIPDYRGRLRAALGMPRCDHAEMIMRLRLFPDSMFDEFGATQLQVAKLAMLAAWWEEGDAGQEMSRLARALDADPPLLAYAEDMTLEHWSQWLCSLDPTP